MVARSRAHPRHSTLACLGDGKLNSARDHKVSHAVVSVHDRHSSALVHHFDVRLNVDSSAANAADIGRQPDDAVPIRALQIGFSHQLCDTRSILFWKPGRLKCFFREALQSRAVYP